MPTFEVRCVACRGWRWPVLPDRPERYVCARCRMVDPVRRVRREQAAARRSKTASTEGLVTVGATISTGGD